VSALSVRLGVAGGERVSDQLKKFMKVEGTKMRCEFQTQCLVKQHP